MPVEFGIAQRVCDGEIVCGDAYVAQVLEDGALVSVIDGLGHGPKAGEAATAFTDLLAEEDVLARGIKGLMEEANRRLSGTRGAAAAVLRVDETARLIEFSGVGNIEMHAVSDVKMHPVCAPGIVGHRVRKLLQFEFELPSSALIALCSDGISSRLHIEHYADLDPQQAADAILEQQGKSHDDATCVVVRYTSEG